MKKLIYLLLFLPVIVFAQKEKMPNGVSFGANFLGGKILVHTPKINIDAPPFSSALELSFKQQTTGKKYWHHKFGYPEAAVNVILFNNGSKILGSGVGLYPSIQFRILSTPTLQWYGKFGGGIGLVSKRWQRLPNEDTMNNIIGSTVNNFTMFQTGVKKNIDEFWTAQAGLHFYHLSNAAARSPNYGINTLGLNVGINYHPRKVLQQFHQQKWGRRTNPLNLSISGSIAFAEDKTIDGPLYPVYTGTLSLFQMYRHKSRIIAGSDAIFNTRTRAIIRNKFIVHRDKYLDAWQFTAFVGHELLFGRIGVPLIAGAYLNRPVGGKLIYQKLGMNYHFVRNHEGTFKDAYLSLILKTHLVQAQYAELGFGFFL